MMGGNGEPNVPNGYKFIEVLYKTKHRRRSWIRKSPKGRKRRGWRTFFRTVKQEKIVPHESSANELNDNTQRQESFNKTEVSENTKKVIMGPSEAAITTTSSSSASCNIRAEDPVSLCENNNVELNTLAPKTPKALPDSSKTKAEDKVDDSQVSEKEREQLSWEELFTSSTESFDEGNPTDSESESTEELEELSFESEESSIAERSELTTVSEHFESFQEDTETLCFQDEPDTSTRTFTQEEIYDSFEPLQLLGEGGFGQVFKVFSRKTSEVFTMKCLDKKEAALTEIDNLKNLGDHPVLQKLHGFIENEDGYSIWMEYAPGFSLKHHVKALKARGVQLLASEAQKIIHDILQGIQHMHESNIAHHDIKLANIVYCAEKGKVKLIDLGLAAPFGPEPLRNERGSSRFYPPEMFDNSCFILSEKKDIWALGFAAFHLFTNREPFHVNDDGPDMREIDELQEEELLDERLQADREILDFFQKALHPDQRKRATADELLSHPWMWSVE